MLDPPRDYNICPCCGTEFHYHDSARTYGNIRQEWVDAGLLWFSHVTPPPSIWNPHLQLVLADLDVQLPESVVADNQIIRIPQTEFGTNLV